MASSAIIDPAGAGDYLTINDWATAQSASVDDWTLLCRPGNCVSGFPNLASHVFNSLHIKPELASYGYGYNADTTGKAHCSVASGGWTGAPAGKTLILEGMLFIWTTQNALSNSAGSTHTYKQCVLSNGRIAAPASSGTTAVTIQNNIFLNCGSGTTAAVHITSSAGATHTVVVQNNSILCAAQYGIRVATTGGTDTVTVENNAVFGASTACLSLISSADTYTCNNNASSDATADDFGGTGHLIDQVAADCFVNASTDLQLKAGSPLLNVGKTLAGITTDILGKPRPEANGTLYDIGAHEFQSAGMALSGGLALGSRIFDGRTLG